MSDLSGKTAVITGASQGIGKAIALRLAQEGCNCFLLARSGDALADVCSEIQRLGVQAGWAASDLSTPEGCESAAVLAEDKFGPIDILVNCAGDTKAGAFTDQLDEDWLGGFALKFFGAVRLTRALWQGLASKKGTVINIGGAAAYTPGANFMIGGAVNAALAHVSKSLSLLGLKDDVNVNIIHPGMTVSDRMDRLLQQEAAASGQSVDEIKAQKIGAMGLRRLGEMDDIAETVAFLCSPKARHIQGVGIVVDGGASTGFH